MSKPAIDITVLGCAGGVARGLFGILDRALVDSGDPLHEFIRGARIHGVDLNISPDSFAGLSPAFREHVVPRAGDASEEDRLRDHLRDTQSEILIDLTGMDCRAPIRACAAAGARYLNSAIEITGPMKNESVRILEEIRIFQEFRRERNVTGIVGAGMNPGVVQWLALDLMRRNADATPLACYVVEHDTTFFRDPARARPDTVYTTWSPQGFLYEAVHSRPIFMRHGTPVALFDHVYSQEFLVRLGPESFYGHLMPHEEVLNLGRLFDMETAFLYRVNDFSCRVLEEAARSTPEDEPACRSLNPDEVELSGSDQVGVLLVYPDRECYAFNRLTTPEIHATYGVNATYFQVACGAAAALASLLYDDMDQSLYYVDELILHTASRFGEYLSAYLKDFTYGENTTTDGLLFDRLRKNRPDLSRVSSQN